MSNNPYISGKYLNISLSADIGNISCINTTTANGTSCQDDGDDALAPEKFYWALLLIPFPMLAVAGNILVMLSVWKEKSLRCVTNYFIVSLAFADLVVAAVAMPFAVYVIVNVNWDLSNTLCDFYIAVDVTCSTASIFNLVAISIDRYIAVTKPISYSKHHRNHKRVFITIAVVWLVSAAIGSPIVLGLNTSPERTPNLCVFYNSDFIIYSSLSSFYIPCLVMVFLYYRIFRAIHERAVLYKRRHKAIENSKLQQQQQETIQLQDQPVPVAAVETQVVIYETAAAAQSKPPETVVIKFKTTIPNNGDSGYDGQSQQSQQDMQLAVPATDSPVLVSPVGSPARNPGTWSSARTTTFETTEDVVTTKKRKYRFNLGKKHKNSNKKRERASAKRERKATKTLAIVLGMFLMCWVPFFTCNIMDAICIKLDTDTWRPGVNVFLITTWLGYINSCVNPVIYTIFNIEFRKAFKKILSGMWTSCSGKTPERNMSH